MPTREEYLRSARNKLSAADAIIKSSRSLPTEVAYLCTVSIECALKRRILSINTFRRATEISQQHQFWSIFNTSKGHNISELIKLAKISIPNHRACSRVYHGQRPYSLRYGEETVSTPHCREEYSFAKIILTTVEKEQ